MIVATFAPDGRPLVWRRVVDPDAAALLAALLADAGAAPFVPTLRAAQAAGEIDLANLAASVAALLAAIDLAVASVADPVVDAAAGGAMLFGCRTCDTPDHGRGDVVRVPDAGEEDVA